MNIGTQISELEGHTLRVTRGVARVARLRDEYYETIATPDHFISRSKATLSAVADIFTFVQPVSLPTQRYSYHCEFDEIALLRLSTFEHWWTRQISDKTRNMVRKARKVGVELRSVEFSDELVWAIKKIYDESPIRQGRLFTHYGKEIDCLKRAHATFLDRSEFYGAYFGGELIGFIKLVRGDGVANLMQIVSMISHRDKAATNALIARAVERCVEMDIGLLHYGVWSRRTMGDFKRHHGFVPIRIPRYYVPLTLRGLFCLRCGIHRSPIARVPESWLDQLANCRMKWNSYRFRESRTVGAVAQLAERHPQR